MRRHKTRLNVGVLELIVEYAPPRFFRNWREWIYYLIKKGYYSIMPQVVSVWCRRQGHRVFYATYYGQCLPEQLLPDDLDIVFISAFTKASGLAYALAELFHQKGTTTVIGGPHAKCFPADCRRFFDITVGTCNEPLVNEILQGVYGPGSIVNASAPPEFPALEERSPEIAIARGGIGFRPIALHASTGCPHACEFCTEWNARYRVAPREHLIEDLRYAATHYPGELIMYHDPTFGVSKQTLSCIEQIPAKKRNPYAMESTLSVLQRHGMIEALQKTGCVYVAPGVESPNAFNEKSGTKGFSPTEKMDHVIEIFRRLVESIGGVHANFILGTDDGGTDEAEHIIRFMDKLPLVWPNLNIPTPFGETPLYNQLLREERILTQMPFAFYYVPYLVTTLRNYDPLAYYKEFVRILERAVSYRTLGKRLRSRPPARIAAFFVLRTIGAQSYLSTCRRIIAMLEHDPKFRRFHEGRSDTLPGFYHHEFEQQLGPYADLVPREQRTPKLAA